MTAVSAADSLDQTADGLDELTMPRSQAGGQPQHLLVTLLGDYWFGQREQLPSAGLVDLLAEFGISAAGARAALGRAGQTAPARAVEVRPTHVLWPYADGGAGFQ